MEQLPPVVRCTAENCFYNRNAECHAPAINVGSSHPMCDTFIVEADHTSSQAKGVVGACHMSQCRWNKALLCSAPGIEVGLHGNEADCDTFSPVT
jgi:hypothetical protein